MRALCDAVAALPLDLLAGVSGGADSVALLLLLKERRDHLGGTLTAVHVNHGLRGDASDGDEAFVRDLCAQWDVPLLTFRATPPAHPGEAWAREARYGFFQEAAQRTGCRDIALAHHQDDQAQTMLEHLLRGAGLTGLRGMLPTSHMEGLTLHRPLLGFPRQTLQALLRERHIPWRQDASNEDPTYLRNAIRLRLLPLMEELAPGAAHRMADTCGLLAAQDAHMAREAAAFLESCPMNGELLPVPEVSMLDMGLRRRVLRAWWRLTPALSLAQTEALCLLPDRPVGSTVNLPGRRRAYRGYRYLHLLSPEEETSVPPVPVHDGACLHGITLRLAQAEENPGDGLRCQVMPLSLLEGCELRTRLPGDRISPFGSGKSQSLQDYLVNRRIDAPFRDRIPLIAQGNRVLLVCGVGAGDVPDCRALPDPVKLCWQGEIPWLLHHERSL